MGGREDGGGEGGRVSFLWFLMTTCTHTLIVGITSSFSSGGPIAAIIQ